MYKNNKKFRKQSIKKLCKAHNLAYLFAVSFFMDSIAFKRSEIFRYEKHNHIITAIIFKQLLGLPTQNIKNKLKHLYFHSDLFVKQNIFGHPFTKLTNILQLIYKEWVVSNSDWKNGLETFS